MESKRDFFRNIDNYILMNNSIMRRDYAKPSKLNPVAVAPTIFRSKFNFTDIHFGSLAEFDGYVCEPGHMDYQQVYNESKWNTYGRVNWDPKPGEWPTIEKLIKHLYGKSDVESDQVEELYDYHTIMVKNPKQKQQARVLYSHVQGTSKSALALLEELMFQDNYCKIRNGEMESDFNSVWVNSILMHMDEPEFNNPKKMSRLIRDLVTSPVMNLRKMKTDYEKVGFYAKLLFTTNDSNFMPFEKSDRRYWIREILPFAKSDDDKDFEDKMRKEVQHYIHFLLHRELKYPAKANKTFWLPDSIIKTAGFKKLVKDNESPLHTTVVGIIERYFLDHPLVSNVSFRLKDMRELVAEEQRVRLKDIGELEVVLVLRENLELRQPEKNSRPRKGDRILGAEIDKKSGKWWTASRIGFDCELGENDVFTRVGTY